jgi:hypothetical protein
MMMHKGQTHIRRNCFSTYIISRKLQIECYSDTQKVLDCSQCHFLRLSFDRLLAKIKTQRGLNVLMRLVSWQQGHNKYDLIFN